MDDDFMKDLWLRGIMVRLRVDVVEATLNQHLKITLNYVIYDFEIDYSTT